MLSLYKARCQVVVLISKAQFPHLNVSSSSICIRTSFFKHYSYQMSQVRSNGSSLIGRVYIPSSPPPQASDNSVEAFPKLLEVEFRLMLEGTHNRGIFNQAKKATYHR
jgi:hypothetical protein